MCCSGVAWRVCVWGGRQNFRGTKFQVKQKIWKVQVVINPINPKTGKVGRHMPGNFFNLLLLIIMTDVSEDFFYLSSFCGEKETLEVQIPLSSHALPTHATPLMCCSLSWQNIMKYFSNYYCTLMHMPNYLLPYDYNFWLLWCWGTLMYVSSVIFYCFYCVEEYTVKNIVVLHFLSIDDLPR